MAELAARFKPGFGARALRCLAAGGVAFSAVAESAAESLTLTTYYPAPSGIYAQMITTGNTFLARDGGNVGIGTASPLHIFHAIDTAGGIFFDGTNATYNRFKSTTVDPNGGKDLLFSAQPAGNTPDLYINNNGYVGVGTSNPGHPMEIDTTVGNEGLVIGNGTAGNSTHLLLMPGTGGGGSYNPIVKAGDIGAIFLGATGAMGTGNFVIAPWSQGYPLAGNPAGLRMTGSNGWVGIGKSVPLAMLDVNGSAGNASGTWSSTSDRRLKRDIAPIKGALATVTKLQGVSFNWKDPKKDAEYGRVRGMIAQEVEQVIPEWVKTGSDGYKRLEPIGIDAMLIEAIKEQQTQIEALRAELAELKTKK